ncbi:MULTISPECIES: hypothetical protein [unclassified Halomonas]|uniref:hypothetical protein n=1 Tax=unclassified Halomonas TaxID=2609666 RepID=UPI001C96DE55|nr:MULTISPECIES: hypothetical protein [unclassified Halomonas]MBY5926939.1 hypothetical protein [Halomonas sp. DP4Y7-2]MBY6233981.1 hypothetical protein [Halomonas sp. DP4Y7-1]
MYYELFLMFEWGGGCLWCGNDIAREKFDVGPLEETLILADEILRELDELSRWHDTALDWEYPPDPSPWNEEEFMAFDKAAYMMVEKLKAELGPEFVVTYKPLPDDLT